MWKYVSRRLKDTFEKTYNVLDPCRRTWTCGEKVKETNCTSHDENKCIAKYNYQLVPSSAENTNGKSNSSSSSYSFHCRTLEAITWSSAIICGWYASQLLCLNRRHQGWESKCKYNRNLFLTPSKAFHLGVFAHLAYAKPNQPKISHVVYENDVYKNDLSKYVKPVNSAREDISEKNNQTVESSFNNLLSVIGDIEFKMGVQNLMSGKYETAVSHLKLGTSHHHAGATFNLGICYEKGLGVKKNMKLAMECYQKASDLGHPRAMYNLGVFHVHGYGGIDKNRQAARQFFQASAEHGIEEAKSALNIYFSSQQPKKLLSNRVISTKPVKEFNEENTYNVYVT